MPALFRFRRFRPPYRFALLLLVAFLCGLVLLHWAGHRPVSPGALPYHITPGLTMNGFTRELVRRGVLGPAERRAMLAWARLRGQEGEMKAGVYDLSGAHSALAILDQVTRGEVMRLHLAFIEGWRFRDMRRALAAAPWLRHTIRELDDEAVMERLGYPGRHPEGRFFPDTYIYNGGDSDLDVLGGARRRMERELAAVWAGREPGLPLQTPYQALILASIIEKETAVAAERPLVAGVMINRLRKGMRLQTDPSVIYGLGDDFDGNLRRKHLRADTPWNTYTRHGLPPTPIAAPGAAALAAALHPAPTTALYFVARGDGSHQFSETLEQHEEAVRVFQLRRKRRAAP